MKKCARCQETKELDQFGTWKRSPDGKQYYCKPCMKEKMHEYYLKNASQKAPEVPKSKVCLACRRDLPPSQFGVRKASKDHLQQYCKSCWRVMTYNSVRKKKLSGKA